MKYGRHTRDIVERSVNGRAVEHLELELESSNTLLNPDGGLEGLFLGGLRIASLPTGVRGPGTSDTSMSRTASCPLPPSVPEVLCRTEQESETLYLSLFAMRHLMGLKQGSMAPTCVLRQALMSKDEKSTSSIEAALLKHDYRLVQEAGIGFVSVLLSERSICCRFWFN